MAEEPIPRPLIDRWWPNLAALVDERRDDTLGLVEILHELGFRHRAGAMRLRERVFERLLELSEEGFAWPSTMASSGGGYLEADDWPKKGMLSFLGYHVGESGLGAGGRREILDFAYKGRLPNVNNQSYMDQWGHPETGARLKKMAESIAAFCRNHKRKNGAALSVQEWESDLEYLRVKYYVGRYSFIWPDTEVT
jgi:hypothetical protein